ncbi:MAG: alpha/beta fold hydrolase [Dehalococcoidia bacterium]
MPHISTNGAEIYYETHGSGEPVLLHPGFGSNANVYWANIAALAERFHVIVLDPRGSGRSSAPEGPYTMSMLAADAAAVLDANGVEAAHVFGTSFGGMVAQHLALEHPGRVRRMVLGCTTPGGTHHVTPAPETVARFIAAGSIEDPAEATRSTMTIHYSDAYAAAHADEIVGRALAQRDLRPGPVGRAGQSAAAQNHDTYDRLPRIAAPTLVAHGEEDPLLPVANARTLAERIPGARLLLYPGARHVFFVECAAALNAEMTSFFNAAEAGAAAAS